MTTPARRRRRSLWINLGSFVALLLLWALITAPPFGAKPLVAPLFLPSPGSVPDTPATPWTHGDQGHTLAYPVGPSLFPPAPASVRPGDRAPAVRHPCFRPFACDLPTPASARAHHPRPHSLQGILSNPDQLVHLRPRDDQRRRHHHHVAGHTIDAPEAGE